MSFLKTTTVAVALTAGLLLSAVAQAHPKLLSSTPVEGSDAAAPSKIELHFSENLTTQFSGAKLIMTDMPGMPNSPMGVKASVAGGSDPKTMVITPAAPLTTGTYKFGLAIFGLYSLRGIERVSGTVLNFESLLYGTSVVGVALSLAAMLLLAKAMSGVSGFMELHHHIFQMVLMGTDVGLTWMVRIAALVMAIIGVALNKRFPTLSLWMVTVCGAIALATLAWTGHGAMDEGSRRYWHFISDIFHLLAAGGWLGALAAFALLLRLKSLKSEQEAQILARVLTGFESAGGVIVAIISITGIVNYLFIVGPNLDEVMLSTYGQLLFLKILLFAGMIVLAALNRFHLSPALEKSVRNGEYSVAVNALRRSMTLEFTMAIVIICLVAWLGTLSPVMEMSAE